MSGKFYKITWNLGDFNSKELELPQFIFETEKSLSFKNEVFDNKNVFIFETNNYPNKTLISNVLEKNYNAQVASIKRC
tara:strand:+ start:320 stop:553 length:234 start_codon:yes stop_codon:yes gene_type:complete